MTMRYDENRKRIICRWEEPTRIVMDKKEGFINRSRMITVKVNDNGKLSSKDKRRHRDHPMFPLISQFNRAMNRDKAQLDACFPCAECGGWENVSPYFDADSQSVSWLCGKHHDSVKS